MSPDRLAARRAAVRRRATRTIGVAPSLGDADLEGDPSPGRGLLDEDEGDAAASASESSPEAARTAVRLSTPTARSSSLPSSNAPSSSPVRKSRFKQRKYYSGCPRFTAVGLEPLPRGPRSSHPIQPSSPGARACCGIDRAKRDARSRSTASSVTEFADATRERLQLGRRPAAGVCHPRFAAPALASACGAEAHRVFTSRNSLGPLRTFIARHNPDLIASGEGGSNLTLVRSPFRCALCTPEEQKAAAGADPDRRARGS